MNKNKSQPSESSNKEEPETTPPDPEKKKFSRSNFQQRKRKFTGHQASALPFKKPAATWEKRTPVTVNLTYPINKYYPIHTSLQGILNVCSTLYSFLITRDKKVTETITSDEFQYVCLTVAIARCVTVANCTGQFVEDGYERLLAVTTNCPLPDFICKYIECIGTIELQTGIIITPFWRNYSTMRETFDFLDPARFLERISGITKEYDTWPVSYQVFNKYTLAVSRLLKNVMNIRNVDFVNIEGKPPFITSFSLERTGYYLPLAPEAMCSHEATLGATYKFRNHTLRERWSGEKLLYCHGAPAVHAETLLHEQILASLRQ